MHTARRFRSAAVPALMAMVLSACLGGRGGGADTNAISVWMFPQGDDEVAIQAFEKAWEKENSGKDLKVVVYPEDQYQTKINTALVAHNPPDIAIVENRDWMKVGYVTELTSHLKDWGVSIDDFNPGGLSRGAVEAKPQDGVYGIGTFLGGNVLAYNKKMFDEAGVEYPSTDTSMTYQEYADLCRKLAKPDPDPAKNVYGCSMPDFSFGFYPIYGADGHHADGNMNAPELAEAFTIGAGLINDKLAPGPSVLDTITETDLFAQNKIAITWTDFSAVPTYEEASIDFGLAPFFVVQGQDDFVDTWTAPWGTFTESKHPDEALSFLKFIATEGQKLQMQATADPPLSTKVAQEAGYGKDDPIKEQFLTVLQNARAGVFVPPGEDVWDPAEVLRLLTVEKQEAQPVLDDLATQAQESLDQVWANWEKLDKGQFEKQVKEEQAQETPAPSE
jgi:multiple sugar transport system substrate-binding protein